MLHINHLHGVGITRDMTEWTPSKRPSEKKKAGKKGRHAEQTRREHATPPTPTEPTALTAEKKNLAWPSFFFPFSLSPTQHSSTQATTLFQAKQVVTRPSKRSSFRRVCLVMRCATCGFSSCQSELYAARLREVVRCRVWRLPMVFSWQHFLSLLSLYSIGISVT